MNHARLRAILFIAPSRRRAPFCARLWERKLNFGANSDGGVMGLMGKVSLNSKSVAEMLYFPLLRLVRVPLQGKENVRNSNFEVALDVTFYLLGFEIGL